jgi:ribosomal protein L34E
MSHEKRRCRTGKGFQWWYLMSSQVNVGVKRMKAENVCEKCGKPEKGYDVQAVNAKLRKVAKGRAGRQVASFLCSRCVQRLVDEVKEEEEHVPEARTSRTVVVGERPVRSIRPANR